MGRSGAPRAIEPPSSGDRFGQLAVLGLDLGPRGGVRAVRCRCDCGNTVSVSESNLRHGRSRACAACAPKRSAATRKRWKGYATVCPDDAHRERLLNRISAILQRCHNPRSRGWSDYGGRGIHVWPTWRTDRAAFLAYLLGLPGWDAPLLELDRADNSRGYEPGNLRFVSRRVNVGNRRTVRELQRENADLRSRLERAEAALRDLDGRWADVGS